MTGGAAPRFYVDGEIVPHPSVRCTAKTDHHPCKRRHDHDEDHKCICGKKWATPAPTSEGAPA